MRMYPRLNYQLGLSNILSILNLFNYKVENAKNISLYFSNDNVFFVDHARTGLKIVLSLLKKNSVVGVQPFTCPTVLEAILNAGCKIHFIDINDHFVIDTGTVKKECEKIDVLLVTHTFGYVADVDSFKEIMKDKLIIEDCAHAFLSERDGKKAGTMSDFSIFSYGFGKFPNSISGGFIIVNNSDYINKMNERVKCIESHSMLSDIKERILSLVNVFLYNSFVYSVFTFKLKRKLNNKSYHENQISKEYKPFGFCMNVLNRSLSKIETYLNIQKSNAKQIEDVVLTNSKLSLAHLVGDSNGFMLLVQVNNPDELMKLAEKYSIELGKHFYKSKFFVEEFGYIKGQCPAYESLIDRYVTIPCHYNYPQNKLQLIKKIIKAY